MRRWNAANRERQRAWARTYYADNVERLLASKTARRYGVTLDEYGNLCKAQDWKCAICGRIPAGRGKAGRLHFDHDHKTRRNRKLLCLWCNNVLGFAGDSVSVLAKAIAYLQEHS